MCGIVGYAGKRYATPILVEGLKNLEYRGYDSCGIALTCGDKIVATKAVGRLDNLIGKLGDESGYTGIGHTRWATHGQPNETNSHPHFSDSGKFAVVHNGIIENYRELKAFLTVRGFNFVSQTDSEVIAHLIEYYYTGDMLTAITKCCNRICGSYALGILSAYEPGRLYAVKKDSPLVIGVGHGENFIASDMPALLDFTREFVLMDDGEIASVSPDSVKIFNRNKEIVEKDVFFADWESFSAQKEGFPHFMLKEIFEQPAAIERTLSQTFEGKELTDILPARLLANLEKIQIIACGSAYHAGFAGKYLIEKLCRIPVVADVASEFIYSDPIINENTLSLVISQSGETADTLSGLRLSKSKGSFTLAIVNVKGSSIARDADYALLTRAGSEIAVATTKGYTTQLAVIYKLAVMLAAYLNKASPSSLRNLTNHSSVTVLPDIESSFAAVPDGLKTFLSDISSIKKLAYNYFSKNTCFFLGRNIDYALALEGALKYKEISYINAQCYPAGELKHGTISLLEKGSLLIVCATEERLLQKTLSNIKEARTRGAICIVITPFIEIFQGEAEHIISLPSGAFLSHVCAIAGFQLLSYYVASLRGCDIDKPRNLAKSVTVE